MLFWAGNVIKDDKENDLDKGAFFVPQLHLIIGQMSFIGNRKPDSNHIFCTYLIIFRTKNFEDSPSIWLSHRGRCCPIISLNGKCAY